MLGETMSLEEKLRPFFLVWDSYWDELCKAKFKYVEEFRGDPQTLSSKKFSCLEEVDKYYTNLIKPLLKEFFDKYPLIEQGLGDPAAIETYKHLNLCPWRTSLPRIEMQVLGIGEKNVLPSKEITFVLSSEKEVALYCHMLLVSLIRKPLRFPKDLSPKSPNIWEFIEGLSKEMQEEFITNLLERLYVLGMKRPEGVEPGEYKKYLEKSINENIELAWSIARHYALLRSQGWEKVREQNEAVKQMVICLIKWKKERSPAGRGEDTETPTLVVGVNKTTREITFGKASRTLNEARSKLLERLNQDKNRTVSKDNLLLFTWGDNPPYESQLYTEIKQLRRAFKAMKIPAKISTVHKVGYKLVSKKDVTFDIK